MRKDIETLFAKRVVTDEEIRQLGSQAVPALIDLIKHGKGSAQEWNCRIALRALGVLGTKEAVGFLVASADNREASGWLRRQAVESMGLAHAPAAFEYLARLVQEHAHERVRDAAVLALGNMATPEALRILQQVVAEDEDPSIRERARRLIQPPTQETVQMKQVKEPDDAII